MIRVGDLLRRPVVALPETATIREVAVELVKNIRHVVVVDKYGELVDVLSYEICALSGQSSSNLPQPRRQQRHDGETL